MVTQVDGRIEKVRGREMRTLILISLLSLGCVMQPRFSEKDYVDALRITTRYSNHLTCKVFELEGELFWCEAPSEEGRICDDIHETYYSEYRGPDGKFVFQVRDGLDLLSDLEGLDYCF